MSEKKFDIIFRGDIVVGQSLADVKQRMATLFNIDDTKVDRLFSGGAVALKRNLDSANAKHYQQLLKKIGVLVDVTPIKPPVAADKRKDPASTASREALADQSRAHVSPPSGQEAQWQLAPVGSMLGGGVLSNEVPVNIEIAHLSVQAAEGYLVDPAEKPALPEVDIIVDDWGIAEVGVDLLLPEELQLTPEVAVETAHLSVGPVGEVLLSAAEKTSPPPIDVDTSGLSLVDEVDEVD